MTTDLTTITTPFGLLDEKTQAQLRAAQSAGMKIEFHDAIRWRWASKLKDYFEPAITYRLASGQVWPKPEPICDGNPTRTDRIATVAIWLGSAAIGISFYALIILWVLK